MFSGNEWVILIIVFLGIPVLGAVAVLAVVGISRQRTGHGASVTDAVDPAGSPDTPPAGWYTDPTGEHEQRYWDGSSWTSTVISNDRTAGGPH